MTRQVTNGEKGKSALIAAVKSVLESLTLQDRISLAVQIIRDAGLRLSYLKMADSITLQRVEEASSLTIIEPPKIPTWNTVVKQRKRYERNELTKIGLFIYDNEPGGDGESTKFREDFEDAITEAFQLGYFEAIKVLQKGSET